MDYVKKFKVSMFLKWVLHDIYDGRGKKCYPCLECYNMYILVSTSYCAPTSRFIFIFLLSIDFLKILFTYAKTTSGLVKSIICCSLGTYVHLFQVILLC